MYKIWVRYQWRSANGIVWCDWYDLSPHTYTLEEGEKQIKEKYANTKRTDQITGLKHEYELRKIE